MSTLQAVEKIITRPWPRPMELPKPIPQIRSTHAARCPECGSEIRINPGVANADVFGGCRHLEAIEKCGEQIAVRFKS